MRLRDILLAWQAAGSPDPANYEVQLAPLAQPAPPAVTPPAQFQQAPPPAVVSAPQPVPVQTWPLAGAASPLPPFPGAPYQPQPPQGEAQFKAERQARRLAEARLFYHEQLGARKVVPAEEQATVTRYLQAANDDDEHGLVQFAGTQPYRRLDALRAEFSAKPAHQWTQELVGGQLPPGASVLGPQFGQDSLAAAIKQATDSAAAYAKQANGGRPGGAA